MPLPLDHHEVTHNGFRFLVDNATLAAHLHHMTDLTFATEHVLDDGATIRLFVDQQDPVTWVYIVDLLHADGFTQIQPAATGATLGVALRKALGEYLLPASKRK